MILCNNSAFYFKRLRILSIEGNFFPKSEAMSRLLWPLYWSSATFDSSLLRRRLNEDIALVLLLTLLQVETCITAVPLD